MTAPNHTKRDSEQGQTGLGQAGRSRRNNCLMGGEIEFQIFAFPKAYTSPKDGTFFQNILDHRVP